MTNKEGSILFQKGNPFLAGAIHMDGGINFCASFREPQLADLLLLDSKGRTKYRIPMRGGASCGACCSVFIPNTGERTLRYRYECSGQEVRDPYAKKIVPGGYETVRGTGEETKHIRILPEDMILYKLHVRGFTKNDPSLAPKVRGTFAGLREKIPYLKDLGINTVELMPCYAFDPVLSNGKKNYWGYSADNYYFAPNPEYSAGDDPAGEVKDLLHSLHEAGISCIMEIYIPEHSSASIPNAALRYWSSELGMDGFHLNGKHSVIEEILLDPLLADRILLLDSASQAISDYQGYSSVDHIFAYQHDFRQNARRFLKGEEGITAAFAEQCRCCPAQYHVVNYAADHNGFTLLDAVSYNERHNEANGEGNQDGPYDLESWNCGAEGPTRKKAVRELRLRQIKNALAFVFLSQGIPMLYAGDEFGNTQKGNSNGYALDNTAGWLDWKEAGKYKELTEYVRTLIRLRKEHSILHSGSPLRGSDYIGTGLPDLSFHSMKPYTVDEKVPAFGILLNGLYAKEKEPFLFIAFNEGWEESVFTIPVLPDMYRWHISLSTDPDFSEERIGKADIPGFMTIRLMPRSTLVLTGDDQ